MRRAVALTVAAVALISCGGDDDATSEPSAAATEAEADSTADDSAADDGGDSDEGTTPVSGSDFDESVLPDDFPRDLIPAGYKDAGYIDTAGLRAASFEVSSAVDEVIASYTELLGEPTLTVAGDPGETSVQWHETDWIVSIIGTDGETFVGLSKPTE